MCNSSLRSFVRASVRAQVGLLSFPPREGELNKPYSDATALLIDQEVGCVCLLCTGCFDLCPRQGGFSCMSRAVPHYVPLNSLIAPLVVSCTAKHTMRNITVIDTDWQ